MADGFDLRLGFRSWSLGRDLEQIRDVNVQSGRETFHVVDGDIALSAFNRADICAVQAGFFRKPLLGKSDGKAHGFQVFGKPGSGGFLSTNDTRHRRVASG